MGYSILTDTLSGNELRVGLFDAQTLSYRKIMPRRWRENSLPVEEKDIFYNSDDLYYRALKDSFDSWNTQNVESAFAQNDDLCKAVNSIVKIRGKRSIKKMKKQSTRVLREVRKMWKRGYYVDKRRKMSLETERQLKFALEIIHKAFRESFIVIRTALRPDVYSRIPQDLVVILGNGEERTVSSLFAFDEISGRYKLNQKIRFSSIDLRCIQLAIVPYIFSTIHKR